MVTGTIPNQGASIFPHRFFHLQRIFHNFNMGSMTNVAPIGLFPGDGAGTQALMSPRCGVEDQLITIFCIFGPYNFRKICSIICFCPIS
jgi:hypothetical protein